MEERFEDMFERQLQTDPTQLENSQEGMRDTISIPDESYDEESLWIEHEAQRETQRCIDDILFFIRHEEEMIQREIQLSIENGGHHIWARNKKIQLEEEYMSERQRTWKLLQSIQSQALINIPKLPEPENHRKARKMYKDVICAILIRIRMGNLIPDDK